MEKKFQKIIETENSGDLSTIKDLEKFYKGLMLSTLGISFLLIVSLIVIILNYLGNFSNYFSFFEMSNVIQFVPYLIAEPGLGLFTEITVIITTVLLFFYFLASINQRGIYIYESQGSEARYFHGLNFILAFFNYILLIPLLFFLFFVARRLDEFFFVLIFWPIAILIFVPLFQNFGKIMFNYSSLLTLNPIKIEKEFKEQLSTLPNLCFCSLRFFLDKRRGIIWEENKEAQLKKDIQYFIVIAGNWVILYVKKQRDVFLKSIISLMFISVFFYYILKFNFLSLIYVDLNFLFWYFIIASIIHIPTGVVHIFLQNGTIFNRVFIVEESRRGYLIILSDDKKVRKVMKESIKYIESIPLDEQ